MGKQTLQITEGTFITFDDEKHLINTNAVQKVLQTSSISNERVNAILQNMQINDVLILHVDGAVDITTLSSFCNNCALTESKLKVMNMRDYGNGAFAKDTIAKGSMLVYGGVYFCCHENSEYTLEDTYLMQIIDDADKTISVNAKKAGIASEFQCLPIERMAGGSYATANFFGIIFFLKINNHQFLPIKGFQASCTIEPNCIVGIDYGEGYWAEREEAPVLFCFNGDVYDKQILFIYENLTSNEPSCLILSSTTIKNEFKKCRNGQECFYILSQEHICNSRTKQTFFALNENDYKELLEFSNALLSGASSSTIFVPKKKDNLVFILEFDLYKDAEITEMLITQEGAIKFIAKQNHGFIIFGENIKHLKNARVVPVYIDCYSRKSYGGFEEGEIVIIYADEKSNFCYSFSIPVSDVLNGEQPHLKRIAAKLVALPKETEEESARCAQLPARSPSPSI